MKELRNKNDWSSEFTKGETAVEWLISKNPKMAHGKSYARFEQYFGTETVREYLDSGGTRGDLRYDWEHKFLDLGDGFVEATPAVSEQEAVGRADLRNKCGAVASAFIATSSHCQQEAVERIAVLPDSNLFRPPHTTQSLSTAVIPDDVMAMVDIEESILS